MQSNKEEADISNTNNWETLFPKHTYTCTHTYMNDGIMPGDKTPQQSHELYNENLCSWHGEFCFDLLTLSPLENRALLLPSVFFPEL